MDYTEFYYIQTVGCYPHQTDEEKLITQDTIQHMLDSGISEAEIIKALETSDGDCFTPEMMPDWLWENSLTERGLYYYHRLLHIVPPVPRFNLHTKTEVKENFYLEIRIRFTLDNLIDHFYDTLMISKDLVDRKRDSGSLKYLLSKYNKLGFVQSLDFVLSLIDAASSDSSHMLPITSILDVSRYEAEAHGRLRRIAAEAELRKTNRIVWRAEANGRIYNRVRRIEK